MFLKPQRSRFLKFFIFVILLLTLGFVIAWFYRGSFLGIADTTLSGSKEPRYIEDQLIVKFKKKITKNAAIEKINKDKKIAKKINNLFESNSDLSDLYYVVELDTATGLEISEENLDKTAKKRFSDLEIINLQKDSDVEYVEKNLNVSAFLEPNDPFYRSSGSWGQSYADQWGLKKINSAGAWGSVTGGTVIVAVIDTGVDYNHPDISQNILKNTSGNVVGWDFYGNDANPDDGMDHGTHVAGIIGASGNNSLGISGLNWNIKIMPVRFLDPTGGGDIAKGSAAIVWAVDHGARVINASWGGPGYSQTAADAIKYAHDRNVVVVAAAGNFHDNSSFYTPSGLSDVITVANSDYNDNLALSSSYGPKLDVTAPGTDILSLRASSSGHFLCVGDSIIGQIYCRMSGTSMASPHVAGLAALILAKNPTWTTEQVRQAIRKGAEDKGSVGWDYFFGEGRINALNSIQINSPLSAQIRSTVGSPAHSLFGTASGPNFRNYEMYYSEYKSSILPSWQLFSSSTTPVTDNNGYLGLFDASHLPNADYVIKLIVYSNDSKTYTNTFYIPMTGTLQGTVTDAVSKRPIGGAKINARIINEIITQSDGKFFVSGLRPGYYVLVATAPRYLRSFEYPAIVGPNQTTTTNIGLTKIDDATYIKFKVVTSSNTPISMAKISTTNYFTSDFGSKASCSTGADGTCIIKSLPIGSYEIMVQKAGFQTKYGRARTTYPRQNFPISFILVP